MFNCEKCGACCKIMGCTYLTEKNLCSNYEDRPDICRVDKMYEQRKAAGMVLDKKDYYKMTKMCCKFFREALKGGKYV